MEIYRGYPSSIEDRFERELRYSGEDPGCEVTRCTVGNGIDAIKVRFFDEDDFFDLCYTLVCDGHVVFIRLDYIPENEAECLPYLESLLNSAEFLNT